MAKSRLSTVQRRGPQIKDVVRAAEALGCTRQTLWAAIHGKRHSPGLLERYRKLFGSPTFRGTVSVSKPLKTKVAKK